jgi:hypothetical protein
MKRVYLVIALLLSYCSGLTQSTPFFLKGTLKEDRQQLYRNLVRNTIIKNLSVPLTDATEEKWQDAFSAMELINYKSAWTDAKIYPLFDSISNYSITLQRALLELAYSNYRDIFLKQVKSLLLQTNDSKIFAMCALYILPSLQTKDEKYYLVNKVKAMLDTKNPNDPILKELYYQVQNENIKLPNTALNDLFDKSFLPGNVVLFSIQRKNRDFPGIVIVRDTAGNFIKNNNEFFSVPQLARSISNLPGYLTNGNTPEGVFRMIAFDTSKSAFIGPTTNIQLRMAFEDSSHFYKDSSVIPVNDMNDYKKLLPDGLREYFPLYESYYASEAGRTEIIAHGTTIDPSWYKNKPYYPLTPTQGCLCSREIWDDETGRLLVSDQRKLVDAVIKAGGPDGYLIVINIDDQQRSVELNDIVNYLQPVKKN